MFSTAEGTLAKQTKALLFKFLTSEDRVAHSFSVVLFFSLLFLLFFSPVLFSNSLLAPGGGRLGDGVLYHLTFFQSKKLLWDPLLFCGFPMMADPQVMTWYPPSTIFSVLPGGWNLFVLSAYVMAACFTYGYVYALTKSRLSSLVSGVVYGMSGFMTAHLGHTAMIHVAVWLPLIVWSLEMQRHRFSRAWFAVTCAAIACCVFAGHLQIVSYSLLLAACYALVMGWSASVGRRNYYLAAAASFVLGMGLTAVQLLPTAELANLSTRSEYGFADFVSYSLPIKQTVSLIFPAVFGGLALYGKTPYFGAWNPTEMAGYVGLLPLILAAIGFTVTRRKLLSIFWLAVMAMALLLALGDQTPLAYLIYRLPVLGKFRAPARHFMEMSFAVSVLAGLGVNAVARRVATRALVLKVISAAGLIVLAGLVVLLAQHRHEYALAEGGTARLNALPWSNPAVAVPLIVFLLVSLAVVWWRSRPDSVLRKCLLVSILVVDVASFGWFLSWRQDAQRKDVLNPPTVTNLANDLASANQRMLAVRGTWANASEAPPNVSRLWGLASAAGYSPLSPARLSELLSMRPDGSVDPVWKQSTNQALNLASVRYVTVPRTPPEKDTQGILWNTDDLDLWLGNAACNTAAGKSIKFDFGAPLDANTLGIVSRLACSTSMPDGAEAVRVTVTDGNGKTETQSLIAGRDTAEWAFDCPTVKPVVKHHRSQVFSNFNAKMNADTCDGHFYSAMLSFNQVKNIQRLEFAWAGQTEALSLNKVTLINPTTRAYIPIDPLSARGNQWGLAGESADARVYENARALPRAWLATETAILKREEILTSIRLSRLPNGLPFDPTRTTLLEDPEGTLPPQARDLNAKATVVHSTGKTMDIETSSDRPSFLVTSDIYYPGWQVYVDGSQARVFVANYAFRGVKLPAGRHNVHFEYVPGRFYFGAGVSALSLLILTGFLVLPRMRRPVAPGARQSG